jgi:hypothetical protein
MPRLTVRVSQTVRIDTTGGFTHYDVVPPHFDRVNRAFSDPGPPPVVGQPSNRRLRFGRRRASSFLGVVIAVAVVVLLLAEGFQGYTAAAPSGTAPGSSVSSSPAASPGTKSPTLSLNSISPSAPGYASLCLLAVIPQCALRESGEQPAATPLNPDPLSSWANITPHSGQPNPLGRYQPSMTYDPATHSVLLFGGYGELGLGPWVFFQDTWSFANGKWTELISNTTCTPSTCPSPRAGAMLAYDANDNGMLLFGGYYYTPSIVQILLDDTWLFSGGVWKNVTASAGTPPSPRFDGSMVWDTYDNYDLLFGGWLTPTVSGGDTWKFASGTWTNITPTEAYRPQPRDGASIADSPSGWIMLFGGEQDATLWDDPPYGCGNSSEAWWFYAGQWVPMTILPGCTASPAVPAPDSGVISHYPPCGRVLAGLGWSIPNNRFVLFGGIGPGNEAACTGFQGFLNDTWTFQNPPGGAFYFKNATDPGYVGDPPLREAMGYATDYTDRYFMIFGGWGGVAPGLNDSWRFNELVHAQLSGPTTIDTNSSHLSFAYPFTVVGYGGSGFLNYRFSIVGLKTGNNLEDAAGSTECANLTNPSGNYSLPYDGVGNIYCAPTPQSYNVYRITVTVFDWHNSSGNAKATANWTFTVLPPQSAIIYSQFKGFFYTNISIENTFSAYLKVANEPAVSVSATIGGLGLGFKHRSTTGSAMYWWDAATPVDMGTLFPGAKLVLTATFGNVTPNWTLNTTYSIKMIDTPDWLSTLVNLPGTSPTLKSHGSGPYNKTWSLADVYNWNIASAFGFDLPIPLIGGSYSLIPGVTITTGLTSQGNVTLTGSYQFASTNISIGPATIKISASISLTGTFDLVTKGVDVSGITWVSATATITVTGDLKASVPIYGFNVLGIQVGFTLNIEIQPKVALSFILVPTTDTPREIIPGLEVTLGKLLGSFSLPLSVSVSFGIGIASVALGGTLSIALEFTLYPTLGLADGWVNGSIFISASALFWSDQWTILGPAVIYSWTDPPPASPLAAVSPDSVGPGYNNGTGTTWKLDSRYYATTGYDQNVWNANSSGGPAVSDIYPYTSVSGTAGYDGGYLYYTNDNPTLPVNQGLGISGFRLNASTNALSAIPSPSDPNFVIDGPQAATFANGNQFVAWAALPSSEETLASPLDLTVLGLHGAVYSTANRSWGPTRAYSNWGIVESYQVDAQGSGGVLLALVSPTFLVGDTTPEHLVAYNLTTGAELSNVSVIGVSSILSLRGGLGDAVLRSAAGNDSVVLYASGSVVPVSVSEPKNTSVSSEYFVSGTGSTLLILYRQPSDTEVVLYDLSTGTVIASEITDQSLVDAKALFGSGTYYVFARSAKEIVGWTEAGGTFQNLTSFALLDLEDFGVVQAGSSVVVYALTTNGNVTAPIVTLSLEVVGAALPQVPGRPALPSPPPATTTTNVTGPNNALYLEYLAIAGAAVGVLLAVIAVVTRKRPKSPGTSASEATPPASPPETTS